MAAVGSGGFWWLWQIVVAGAVGFGSRGGGGRDG
jgi:hypothetical protein